MRIEIELAELELGFPNVCSISGALTTNRVRRHVWMMEREAMSAVNALAAFEGAIFATAMSDYRPVPAVIFVPMSEAAVRHQMRRIRSTAIRVIAVLAFGVAGVVYGSFALATIAGVVALLAIRAVLNLARVWPRVRLVSSDRLVISPVHPDFAKAIMSR